ncbi:sporulation protein [Streptomyces hydrogenans]|uniref:sporulation protein n=1 Tax=Streptomyces hydrogenans TaxID=1873719 RepID=UPI003817F95E
MDSRRRFLTTGFALGAYTMPVTRWLAKPATAATPPSSPAPGPGRVGRADLDGLWAASEEARVWDSRFGGGHWQNSSVTRCLQTQAAPMLRGTYTESVGRELFAATPELSRVVGWAAFDAGHHDTAQRHFIQALSLARSAGDIETGCYVLTTMALQTMLRGFPDQAADMAEGAYERGHGHAAPRVLAFAKLAEARAHGRTKDGAAAGAALAQAELLLDAIQPGAHDPQHLAYFTPERLAADAIEIHRDLGQPHAALSWNRYAEPMPAGRFTRAVGIRHAVLASSHTHAGDLDRALNAADRALGILSTVQSTRAHTYLHTVTTDLQRWPREPRVRDFAVRVHTLVGSPRR